MFCTAHRGNRAPEDRTLYLISEYSDLSVSPTPLFTTLNGYRKSQNRPLEIATRRVVFRPAQRGEFKGSKMAQKANMDTELLTEHFGYPPVVGPASKCMFWQESS